MTSGKRQQLLVLCNDLPTIRAVTDSAGRYFELLWVREMPRLEAELAQAQQPPPAAVVADHAFQQVSAVEVLSSVRRMAPSVRRILLTDYCDLSLIVQGLHTGAVERIVYKPIFGPELLNAIGRSNLPASLITPATQADPHCPPQTRAAG